MNHDQTFQPELANVPASRRFPAVAWVCALSSCILLALYLLLAWHIRLDLGRWPVPMFEQYREPLLFRIHCQLLVIWGLFSIFAAGPIWLLSQFMPALRPASSRARAGQLALLIGGWLSVVLFCNFDPTPFTDWLLD